MPLSHKHKCLFIHIPKTGGTSIETALGIFGNWKIENLNTLFGLINSEKLNTFNYKSNFLQHLTYTECQKTITIPKDYTSFSFVRNPWDKLVSIYSNPDNNLIEYSKSKNINLRELSFSKFIEIIHELNHIHLEHQHTFIYDQQNRRQVDFLGRFEVFHQDFNKLCKELGIKPDLPHTNKSNHKQYRDYYTHKTKIIVSQFYEQDIDLFNYTF